MRSGILAALAFGVALSAAALANRAAASEYGALRAHWRCDCARDWPHRQYWQWDHRPIWDDPWQVLKPNFFGSPEPHLVPADIWAQKWHPLSLHYGRPHRRHWRHWRRAP